MNARKLISFLRSPTGLILLFLVAVLFVVIFSGRLAANQDARIKQQKANATNVRNVGGDPSKAMEVFSRDTAPLKMQPVKATPRPLPPKATPAPTPTPKKPEMMKIYGSPGKLEVLEPKPEPFKRIPVRKFSERYAPYGRMLKCELVNTLDSTSSSTPIIAMVMEDLWWHQELIVPAGSEVHGSVSSQQSGQDRIVSDDRWVIVMPATSDLPHGSEMVVTGHALDMADPRGDGLSWGITDGSFGIQGYTIKTAEKEDVKLFISTFLSGAAQALQTRQNSAFGGQLLEATPQNAALNGTSAVLNKYAEDISEQIRKYGVYTRVPAGKQFYLYLKQTVDSSDARVGDSSVIGRDERDERETQGQDDSPEARIRAGYERAGIIPGSRQIVRPNPNVNQPLLSQPR